MKKDVFTPSCNPHKDTYSAAWASCVSFSPHSAIHCLRQWGQCRPAKNGAIQAPARCAAPTLVSLGCPALRAAGSERACVLCCSERGGPEVPITSAALEDAGDISRCFKGRLESQALGPGARAGARAPAPANPGLRLPPNAAALRFGARTPGLASGSRTGGQGQPGPGSYLSESPSLPLQRRDVDATHLVRWRTSQ